MTARSILSRIKSLERGRRPVECKVCMGRGGAPRVGFEGGDMPTAGRPCRACGKSGCLMIFTIVDGPRSAAGIAEGP